MHQLMLKTFKTDVKVKLDSGGSRNSKRGFSLVVDPRRGGLGAQSPAAEQVLILKGMQSNEILLNYISYS